MLGFYEEMADLAAMNEDDGFLGQCAGSEEDKVAPEAKNSRSNLSNLSVVKLFPPRPRQLKLSPDIMSNNDRHA
jgi:hypothetical protein